MDNTLNQIKEELLKIQYGELIIKIQAGKVYLLEKRETKKI
jgi:hypothetical protein